MTKNGRSVFQLVVMMLWCIALLIGSVLFSFMAMLFAGEPSGGGIAAAEILMLAIPPALAILLTTVLFMLWHKGYFKTAWAIWLGSLVLLVPAGCGYVF